MTQRKPLPDILTGLATATAPAPGYDLAAAIAGPGAALAAPLRYDYASLGAAGEGIRLHALAIKHHQNAARSSVIEAGLCLIAAKASMPHGHWLPWLDQEFGMTDRMAQHQMAVAETFGGAEIRNRVSYLTDSAMYMLAPASVPDAARAEVLALAEERAASPTKTEVKQIIAAHRPARCRKCGRTLTDPDAIRAGIGACCAARLVRGAALGEAKADAPPLPEWVTDGEAVAVAPWFVAEFNNAPAIVDPAPAPTVAPPRGDSAPVVDAGADGRTLALARLAARLEGWIEELRDVAQQYGELTGDFTTPLAIRRGFEKMRVVVQANGENGGWD